MKIDWETVVSVLVALLIFKVVDKLFLDAALSGLTGDKEGSFEVETV
jgi:hypothetical protein